MNLTFHWNAVECQLIQFWLILHNLRVDNLFLSWCWSCLSSLSLFSVQIRETSRKCILMYYYVGENILYGDKRSCTLKNNQNFLSPELVMWQCYERALGHEFFHKKGVESMITALTMSWWQLWGYFWGFYNWYAKHCMFDMHCRHFNMNFWDEWLIHKAIYVWYARYSLLSDYIYYSCLFLD